jgi:hypothetical protein
MRDATFQKFSLYFCEKIVDLSSYHKNTQVKKKNRLKQSPGSQDIEVLNMQIFRVFFVDGGVIFLFYFYRIWRPNLPK